MCVPVLLMRRTGQGVLRLKPHPAQSHKESSDCVGNPYGIPRSGQEKIALPDCVNF